jgi:aspartate aminotransferase-like enzyme
MWEEFGIATAGGSPSIGPPIGGLRLQDYVGFRVGTMGFVATPEAVYAFLAAIEEVLPRMGYEVKRGVALPAAQAVFAAGNDAP